MNTYDFPQERVARLVKFEFLNGYQLGLVFDSGEERVIDFEPILYGPVFGPLRDPDLFRQAQLVPEFGALEWPNGADIAPDVLYDWDSHLPAMIERRRRFTPHE